MPYNLVQLYFDLLIDSQPTLLLYALLLKPNCSLAVWVEVTVMRSRQAVQPAAEIYRWWTCLSAHIFMDLPLATIKCI